MQNIDIKLDGIGHVLSDRRLVVPRYQRSYAWEDRNVLELLTDLERAKSNEEAEYFLGSIVVTGRESDPEKQVVDGQQRLATAVMILAEIRNIFASRGDLERAGQIQSEFLAKRNLRTQEQLPQLRLNDHDTDFFLKRILDGDSATRSAIQPLRLSHRLIDQAATITAAFFRRLDSTASDFTERLIDWVDYLKGNSKVILVTVPDDANAYAIFETLNDRGLDLSISDLLKNYLFQRAGDRLQEVQTCWTSMYGLFEGSDMESEVVGYIRQLWSSTYGLTRERELYDRIKREITGKQRAVDFAKSLMRNARLYHAISTTDQMFWTQYGSTSRQHMQRLNLLGITRVRPLILAVLDHFDAEEIKKSLRLMVSWAVRFMIVGGLGTGTLEEYYSLRAKEIRDGVLKDAKGLSTSMANLVPSDSRFKEAFARANVAKPRLARYYLQTLERQVCGEHEPELIPNENEDEVNLEHVLPKTPGAAWSHITSDIADIYTNRLGNLALLQRSPNCDVGNASFLEKIEIYRQSNFILTQRISEVDTWGKTEIEERQAQLADLAVSAWSMTV
jgi:hypothetical protein